MPGRPDIVFPTERLAVFVQGCFWHGCSDCRLPRPQAHAEFWSKKLADNIARDSRVKRELQESGWGVVEVWEHAVRHDAQAAAADVLARRTAARERAKAMP